jgi:HK97 family phage portal protein
VQGGDYQERIAYVRGPEQALVVGAVYRAVNLRADTMSVMPVQYQKRDFEKGNYYTDMRGLGKRMNYLLQEEPNPIMSASSLWELVHINRLMKGNGLVYIERDEFGFPLHLWLVKTGAYNIVTGNFVEITYLSDYGYMTLTNVPASDVLHFPNTYRYQNGIWGISTLDFALDTLALNKTLRAQALETAGKGGRVKLILSEGGDSGGVAPIANGRFDPDQVKEMAKQVNKEIYEQDVIAIQNLTDVKQISMTQAEMQAIEQVGMTDDDVARFYGTPRPLLMLDTNSHYNDYQNATMEYHTRTILPDANDEAKEIYRKLIGFDGYGTRDIHVCEKPLLTMDPEKKAKYYESMLRTGTMTVNEIRAQEDMPSVGDKGDIVYVLTNLAELGSAKLRDVAGGGRPTTQEPPKQEPPKEGEGK